MAILSETERSVKRNLSMSLLSALVNEGLKVIKHPATGIFRLLAGDQVFDGGVEGGGEFEGFIGAGKVPSFPLGVIGTVVELQGLYEGFEGKGGFGFNQLFNIVVKNHMVNYRKKSANILANTLIIA
jgi:hypothetical protein